MISEHYQRMEDSVGHNLLIYSDYVAEIARKLGKDVGVVDHALGRAAIGVGGRAAEVALAVDQFLSALAEAPQEKRDEPPRYGEKGGGDGA